MKSILRNVGAELLDPLRLAIFLGISVVLTIAGPFGSQAGMDVPARFVYWALLVGSSLAMAAFFRESVISCVPNCTLRRRGLCVTALMTLFYSPFVYGVTLVLRGPISDPLGASVQIAATVFFVSLSIAVVHLVLDRDAPAKPEGPRILDRLEDCDGKDLIRMSVRDHYVDVTTAKGQTSLLMRFSDAITEAEGISGLQVHRSHWVVRDAVTKAETEKGKLYLVTKDGARVPVSRNYRDAVREAGFG